MGVLQGKIAFITGAASGMGRSAALLFAGEGAKVVGCDVQAQRLAETAQLVRDAGGDMHVTSPVDLGDADSAAGWIEEGVAAFDGIDILYNNASAVCFSGSVTVGNEADLVLLDADPTNDSANLHAVSGVACRGEFFDDRDLRAIKDRIAGRHAA